MDPAASPQAAPRVIHSAAPDHRELYLIVAGVLLGILLGPAALGRLAPEAYERAFVGPPMRDALDAYARGQTAFREERKKLAARGAGPAALAAFDDARKPGLEALQDAADASLRARARHAQRLAGLTTLLVLAALALMVVEALRPAHDAPASPRRSLVAARYALLALWLALLLAQPAMLASLRAVWG